MCTLLTNMGILVALSVCWSALQTPLDYISQSLHMYAKCFSTLKCCGWAYGSTLTVLHQCRSGVWVDLCPSDDGEAQTPRGVYSTSICYVCIVFKHLDMLLMGIWVHPHSVCLWRSGVDFWDNFGVDLSLRDDVMPRLRLKPPVEHNPHP